jgi:hypothetical protein
MGRTYGGDRPYANGAFKGKRAMLALTTGGPVPAYLKGSFNGDIHAILRPIQRGMLQFVGFELLAPQIAYGPVRLDQGQRTELLAAYAERLKNIAGEQPSRSGFIDLAQPAVQRSSIIVKTKPVKVAPTPKASVNMPTKIIIVVLGSSLWAISALTPNASMRIRAMEYPRPSATPMAA